MKSSVIILLLLSFCFVYSEYMNDTNCGVVASENPIHQHPWLVLLEYYYGNRRGHLRCGGTLIDSRHILTSAHCVEIVKSISDWRRSITILPRLGEYNMSSRRDCAAGVCSDPIVRMVVDSVHVHPWFYRDLVSHDLAILVLETDAPYTDFIRPICLPTRTAELPSELYASGFGDMPNSNYPTQIKKNIRLSYYIRCPAAYERIYQLPKDGFCAGGEENVDTCNGDSGGPIIWIKQDGDHKRAELWGVIKGGTKRCGLKGKPGVYTSVLQNLPWIKKVIERTAPKQQDSEMESKGNGNEEKENGEKPQDDSKNGENQGKQKHKDVVKSGQIRSGLDYLLIFMLLSLLSL